ncbi:MAG TPA: response regulator [Burkholderiaceae bacterium]|nr:response regulator [Burkholderiaceae bacterium]
MPDVRVLVVDDEPDARELLRHVLEERGAVVSVAASALEALDAFEAQPPQLVICDIGMAGIDGYELVRRIRARPPELGGRIPAVAVTAFARTEDRTRALLAGFNAHLAKPIDSSELVAALASLAALGGTSLAT